MIQNMFPDSLNFLLCGIAGAGIALVGIVGLIVTVARGARPGRQSVAQPITTQQAASNPAPMQAAASANAAAAPVAANGSTAESDLLPLRTRKLMSKSEAAFYWRLKEAVGRDYIIAPKVGLDDVFRKRSQLAKDLFTMYRYGHIDFLLLHPRSWAPVAGIELDDSTHATPEGKDRSQRKTRLFAEAGLPLKRYAVAETWEVAEIREWLAGLAKTGQL